MYSRGDIVLIPIPFTDLSASKKRPVLVISNDTYNASSQDMIVVAITSNLIQPGISVTTADLTQGQLPKPSVIRSDKIYTLDQNIVVKPIGHVRSEILSKVESDVIDHISA